MSRAGVQRSKYTWVLHSRMLACKEFYKLLDQHLALDSPRGFEAVTSHAIHSSRKAIGVPLRYESLLTALMPASSGNKRRALTM